ncbi:MAG: anthranilate phosphoribosyltransferase [Bacteroidales bacterium]
MKLLLNKLLESQTLSRQEAFDLMHGIADERLNHAQIAAVLASFIMRSISLEELMGFRKALLELAIKPDLNNGDVIDLCGTGGDGRNTFNISTLASIVTAGAGIPVGKHGNYGVSSNSGSSNVMEHFGYRFSNDEDKLKRELDATGITFMHAPLFHPALKAAGPVRKQLGIKSFFNILGPLVNPAKPHYQTSGVFNLETGRIYSYLLQKESKDFRVVHSLDGYDEISLTSDSRVFSLNGEQIVTVDDFGFTPNSHEDLYGGEGVEDAAGIFLKVLKNEASEPQKNVVVANSAMAINCYNKNLTLREAAGLASDSLSSGRALKTFNKLIDLQ